MKTQVLFPEYLIVIVYYLQEIPPCRIHSKKIALVSSTIFNDKIIIINNVFTKQMDDYFLAEIHDVELLKENDLSRIISRRYMMYLVQIKTEQFLVQTCSLPKLK